MKTDKKQDIKSNLKKSYQMPNLQLFGKLTHATQGGNSSCADGPQTMQQCSSGVN